VKLKAPQSRHKRLACYKIKFQFLTIGSSSKLNVWGGGTWNAPYST
jgi:hypothetical protein